MSEVFVILYIWRENDEIPGVTTYGYTNTREEANIAVDKLLKESREWRKTKSNTSKKPTPYFEESSPWDGFFVFEVKQV